MLYSNYCEVWVGIGTEVGRVGECTYLLGGEMISGTEATELATRHSGPHVLGLQAQLREPRDDRVMREHKTSLHTS